MAKTDQECPRVSESVQECPRVLRGCFNLCSGGVARVFRGCSEDVPSDSRGCPRIFRGCSEVIKGYLRVSKSLQESNNIQDHLRPFKIIRDHLTN